MLGSGSRRRCNCSASASVSTTALNALPIRCVKLSCSAGWALAGAAGVCFAAGRVATAVAGFLGAASVRRDFAALAFLWLGALARFAALDGFAVLAVNFAFFVPAFFRPAFLTFFAALAFFAIVGPHVEVKAAISIGGA